MSTTITRRNLLKLIGGSAAGLFFTPLPWKLLDDSSIWTQNGPWIPKVPRGPVSYSYTVCALCPAGCSMKARLVGTQSATMAATVAVSLTGVADHPVSHGMVCPIGLAGHHLAYHPERIKEAQRVTHNGDTANFTPVSLEEIITQSSSRAAEGPIAVLDGRPGSTMSRQYRAFAGSIPTGLYVIPPYFDGQFMATLGAALQPQPSRLGLHFEKAATILSFGVPLLDGWSGSAEVVKAFATRREQLKIFQVDSAESSTAICADKWLQVKPGTEAILALAIGHVIVREKLYDTANIGKADMKVRVSEYTPEYARSVTGVPTETIIETARQFAAGKPSIAVASDFMNVEEQEIVWGLNLLVGALGKNGCVSQRVNLPVFDAGNKLAPVTTIKSIPDASIRLLVIDSSVTESAIPWSALERKLIPNESTVVQFSPYKTSLSQRADFVIPTAAPYESIQEIAANPYSPVVTFSISAPLMQSPAGTAEPVQFLQKMVASNLSAQTIAEALRAQADAIFKSGRGSVYTPSDKTTRNISEYFSADDFWTALTEGGCWKDDLPERPPTGAFTFSGRDEHARVAVGNVTPGFDARFPAVSPILSKLTRESHLKQAERV